MREKFLTTFEDLYYFNRNSNSKYSTIANCKKQIVEDFKNCETTFFNEIETEEMEFYCKKIGRVNGLCNLLKWNFNIEISQKDSLFYCDYKFYDSIRNLVKVRIYNNGIVLVDGTWGTNLTKKILLQLGAS